jgi:Sulfotransferase domain
VETSGAITIVSGLPRSGTSLMMQMLAAGDLAPLTDGERSADADNPRGYFELERVKRLKIDSAWLEQARGKAVKVIHLLLRDLPVSGFVYRVILMRRRMPEVLASQRAMLARQGRTGAVLSDEKLGAVFADQMAEIKKWLASYPVFQVLPVWYHELIANPASEAKRVREFVGGELDAAKMAAVVDATLYRQRIDPS